MKWFILFVGVIVVCFVVALILGLASGAMSRPTSSLSHEPLPDDPIEDADFDGLAFDVAARGYRMSQVDGVVDRLRRELREKDAEIAVLRGEQPAGPDADETRTDELPAFDVAGDLPTVEAGEERPEVEAPEGRPAIEAPEDRPAIEAADEPIDEPIDEPVAEAAEEPAAEAAEEPAAEPVAEAAEEPAAEPVVEAAEEPAAEPVVEAAEEPVEEPAAKQPAAKQPAARGSRTRPATRRRPPT
ncbi:hypothetical protein GCM10027053_53430 [Intrasporangium mesophilum]